ncbi:hypothetical protein FQK07_01185 [Synechococcus sp. BSF8S]|nr:hypothetical protein [Synechococcus sp. BSF8S]
MSSTASPMPEAGARRRSRRSSPEEVPAPPKRWAPWVLPLVAGLGFGGGYGITDRLLAVQTGGPAKLDQGFEVKPFPGTTLESLRLRYGADREELRGDLELIELERKQEEEEAAEKAKAEDAKAKAEQARREAAQKEKEAPKPQAPRPQPEAPARGSSPESAPNPGTAADAPRSEAPPEPVPPALSAPPPPSPEPLP